MNVLFMGGGTVWIYWTSYHHNIFISIGQNVYMGLSQTELYLLLVTQ